MAASNESPLKQYYDAFDIKHSKWSLTDYKEHALKVPLEATNRLLLEDWTWRAKHQQNVVASMEGDQGSGKSMPFLYCGLLLGQIFNSHFSVDNLFFSIEKLNDSIGHAKHGQTFIYDEHRQTRAGLMSLMQAQNLADYEEQLRISQNNLLFSAVELHNHAHFFTFEAKHIVWNEDGTYPLKFISVLKTKRYTNRKDLVWRGLVSFPMPNEKIVEKYLEKKTGHIKDLKAKYSSTLDPVRRESEKIFEKRLENLTRTTKDGFILPIQAENLMFLIDEEIGTRKFTIKGYTLLQADLKRRIEEHYKEVNEELSVKLELEAKEHKLEKLKLKKEEDEASNQGRMEKIRLKQEELDLKRKEMELKEREIALKEKQARLNEKPITLNISKD